MTDYYTSLYCTHKDYEEYMDKRIDNWLSNNTNISKLTNTLPMDKLIEEVSNYQLMHKFNTLIIEMIDYCKSIDLSLRNYNTFLNIGMLLIATPLKLAKYRYSDNAIFLKYYEEMYSRYFQSPRIPIVIDVEKIENICKKILQLFVSNNDTYLIEFQVEPNSTLTIHLKYYHIIYINILNFLLTKTKN